jgi:hypothetical protein
MDDYQNTEEWHKRLNDATWAATRSWDSEVMGPMTPKIFNNMKPLIKAAILNFLNSAPPKRENELDAIDRAYFAGKQAGIAECEAVNREWVSLTDEEFRAICKSLSRQDGWDGDGWDLALKQAIEAKLKEKNA